MNFFLYPNVLKNRYNISQKYHLTNKATFPLSITASSHILCLVQPGTPPAYVARFCYQLSTTELVRSRSQRKVTVKHKELINVL